MSFFQISNSVLCEWLSNERDKKKDMSKVIMEKIRSNDHLSDEKLGAIESKLIKVFLPHYRRCMKKFGRKASSIEVYAKNFWENKFIVEFPNVDQSLAHRNGGKFKITRSTRNTRREVGRPTVTCEMASIRTKYRLKEKFSLKCAKKSTKKEPNRRQKVKNDIQNKGV